MILIIGIILLIVGVAMTVIYIVHSRRPKAEAVIESVFYQRLKTDKTNELGERKHGKATYRVGAQTYEAAILVFKKTQAGDKIMITYKESNPQAARIYSPGKEIIAIISIYVVGIVLVCVSIFVKNQLG